MNLTKDISVQRLGMDITFSVEKKISIVESYILQTELGYPPEGYGSYGFHSTSTLTTWRCSTSSD